MSKKFLTGIDVNGQPITSVPSPSNPTDAANKQYVDNALAGLAWKQPVRAATTGAVTLSTAFAAGQVLDGVTLVAGMRILNKDAATGTENGIYTVNASGAPTRATDADSTAELNNATVYIMGGTVNSDRAYTQTANDPTVGTTALTFAQVGGGTAYSAGFGLGLNGTTFSVVAGSGIIADGTSTRIDPSYTGLAKRYAVNAPTTGTTVTITHNLATTDVVVRIYDTSTANSYVEVDADVVLTGANTATITFATAPTSGQYRIVVVG